MSETWVDNDINDALISIKGYNLLRNDRNRHGGGICVYYKTNLQCIILQKSQNDVAVNGNSTEYLLLNVLCNNEHVFVGVYYNPPNNDCSDIVFNHLELYKMQYNSCFIIGDFNVDFRRANRLTTRFSNELESLSFTCINQEPTFFFQTGCSVLDLLITDAPEKVIKFNQISMPGISRHDLIFAALDITCIDSNTGYFFRDYKHFNSVALRSTFEEYNWNNFLSVNDTDVLLDTLNERLVSLHERYFPPKFRKYKKNIWFNNRIQRAIIDRNIAYSNWKRNKSADNERHYKRLRNNVNLLIKNAKNQYNRNMINTDLPSKKLWQNIKKLGVSNNTQYTVDCPHTSEEINNYFSSNYTTDNEVLPEISHPYGDFRFRFFEDYQIVNAIYSVKSNALGIDSIPLQFIHIILPLALPMITHVFNAIISTSKFPRAWKLVKVIPIKKKASSTDVGNLRPISILCALSKAFEKLIKLQISDYLNDFGLLNPFQSGFRKNHSTETALTKVHDDIARSVDKRGATILVLIDFAKAFDRVSHKRLLKKLASDFGFSGAAIKLIKSYLEDRSQAVFHNGKLSTFQSIESGVPQGSVIGPLLFSLFINDLPSILKHCSVHLFADDVQIYYCSEPSEDIDYMTQIINSDLQNVLRWSLKNALPINPSKTKAIFLSKHRAPLTSLRLVLDNHLINFAEHVNNLGVIVNEGLFSLYHRLEYP